jgi:peroxiredoxin
LGQLQKIEKDLLELGYQIVAVSPDRVENLQESIGKLELSYQVVSDDSMEGAKAFGVAFRVDDDTYEKYKGWGLDLEKASGFDHHYLPVPAVYLIDREGLVRFQYVNPNYRVRLHPDILLAAAKAEAP